MKTPLWQREIMNAIADRETMIKFRIQGGLAKRKEQTVKQSQIDRLEALKEAKMLLKKYFKQLNNE